jgi:two-component system LytT family response regulator
MKILTTDNEKSALNILNRAILEVVPDAELRSFTRASASVKEVVDNGFLPDAAFLDIEMPGMTGIELAGRIKKASPRTWIVFVTGFSQYALDAYSVHAGGYLMKPVTPERVREELEQIGLQREPEPEPGCRIRVQCFGNFEIFLDGHPLEFPRKKAKELFAYLVHKRGTASTTRELASVLFEDAPYD